MGEGYRPLARKALCLELRVLIVNDPSSLSLINFFIGG